MIMELVKYPDDKDWILCKTAALVSVGKVSSKTPTLEWKRKILSARHSPIRFLNFVFYIKDIPYYISTHLARHVHAIPVIKTQRNDRQEEYDRNKAPQDALVNMMYGVNAEELLTIANKRLCTKAAPETRAVVKQMCDMVLETNPEFEGLLVPMCVYRNGLCSEPQSCGLCENVRARVTYTGKDNTVEIAVPEVTYSKAGRILLIQENSNYATLYYPDGGGIE